jgi:hypothetical protein
MSGTPFPNPTFQSITVLEALNVPQPLLLSSFCPGSYSADMLLVNWELPLTGTFLPNLAGSMLTCDPNITAPGTITFCYGGTVSGSTLSGGTVFATGVFSSGSNQGIISSAGVTITAPNNVSMLAPNTPVASLQNISTTLLGQRTS